MACLSCTVRLASNRTPSVVSIVRITLPLQGRPRHDRQPRHLVLSYPPRPGLAPRLLHRVGGPPREQGRIHRLDEIIFISICAVTCGADSWEEIASYAHSKIDWLQTVLTLPGGVPSHDTFRRVFCLLDPLAFQECFYAWMTAVMNRRGLTPVPLDPPELKPVAIDGKCQRFGAAHRRSIGPARRHRLVGGESPDFGPSGHRRQIQRDYGHSRVARALDLEGAMVTIDAMGCQKDIAAKIVGGGGQYALAVKENQPHLYEEIERAFDEALDQGEPGVDFTECQTEGPRKGRQETRLAV